ncbi:MAG: hypothetical protein U5L00_02430 [Desulfovermiculus sp.]|nr:hypothetical protein [Desulfovermiculus sp.]
MLDESSACQAQEKLSLTRPDPAKFMLVVGRELGTVLSGHSPVLNGCLGSWTELQLNIYVI